MISTTSSPSASRPEESPSKTPPSMRTRYSTPPKMRTSQDATSYLSGSLRFNKPMCTHHHQSTIHTAAASSRKEHRDGKDTFLQALLKRLPPKVKKHLEHAGTTGIWLTTIPDFFSSTELTTTKWFDNIALRYGSQLPHLPSHCNGCSKGFTVKHALNCKKGGFSSIRHNDARDK
ncbi:hypothetical protein ACHAW6_004275 [Cyclotella cf. meneghiniana]